MRHINIINHQQQEFTILLSSRNYVHYGSLVNYSEANLNLNLNSADELSFVLYKQLDDFIEPLWDKVIDLKLVYIKELDEYFEIAVSTDDSDGTKKTITGTSLCEAELSQTNLYNIEINTEVDIERDDYDVEYPTVFYRSLEGLDPDTETYKKTKESSLLHRILDKVPHYSIAHIDDSLKDIQLSFSINGTSIYDWLVGECSEQFNCLFQFDSTNRTISAYDLYGVCEDCGYRSENLWECPQCGSTNIKHYGDNTTVYIDKENLSDNITITANADEIKNCFKLEAGDEDMTAAVLNLNPNGTQYIYYISPEQKEDMSDELVEVIENYDKLYNYYMTRINDDGESDNINLFTTIPRSESFSSSTSTGDGITVIYNSNGTIQASGTGNYIINILPKAKVSSYALTQNTYLKFNCMGLNPESHFNYIINDDREHMLHPCSSGAFDDNHYLIPNNDDTIQIEINLTLDNQSVTLYPMCYVTDEEDTEYSFKPYSPLYADLVKGIYQFQDDIFYYTNYMMPTIERQGAYTAAQEAAKLTTENIQKVSLVKVTTATSLDTVESAIKNYAKCYYKSGYFKAEPSGVLLYDDNNVPNEWVGKFKVTNYSDEDDIAESEEVHIAIDDELDDYVYQLVLKDWNDGEGFGSDEDTGSIYDVLKIQDLDDFIEALELYSLNRLKSFQSALMSACEIVAEQYGDDLYRQTEPIEQPEDSEPLPAFYSELYNKMYLPYVQRLNACELEIDKRSRTIAELSLILSRYQYVKNTIQDILNFKNYIETNAGENSYKEFCAYKREDEYNNKNFISDDLDNKELINKATEFIEYAKKELVKAGTRQFTIDASLKDLLLLDEFEPIRDSFELGNWINVKVDNILHRLRLISYTVNSPINSTTIDVEFSDVTKVLNSANDVKSILASASSMSSSYSYVSKQATQGSEASDTLDDFRRDGLDSSIYMVKNADTEDVIIARNGITCRSYNDITDTYEDEQLKIVHNTILFTDDNWETAKCSLGKQSYLYYDSNISEYIWGKGYGLNSDFVNSGYVHGSQIIGGDIYSEPNSEDPTRVVTHLDLNTGRFSFADGRLTYDGQNLVIDGSLNITSGSININDDTFVVTPTGVLTATSGTIGNWTIGTNSLYNALSSLSGAIPGTYIGTDGIKQYQSSSSYIQMVNGQITAVGANIKGTVQATNGYIGTDSYNKWTIGNNSNGAYLYNGTDGLDSDDVGVYIGTDGIRQVFEDEFENRYALDIIDTNIISTSKGGYILTLGDGSITKTSTESNFKTFELASDPDLGMTLRNKVEETVFTTAVYGGSISITSGTKYVNINTDLGISTNCNLTVTGTKNRCVETEHFGNRLLYCYETPTPMFGDVGSAKLDKNGKCIIYIDEVFKETINSEIEYQVFVQPYNDGKCYVTERTPSYFVVNGKAGIEFAWEIKAVQRGYEDTRLEEYITEQKE